MIQVFKQTEQSLVNAVAGPKHIWFDINRIVVYTGADIPPIAPSPPSMP